MKIATFRRLTTRIGSLLICVGNLVMEFASLWEKKHPYRPTPEIGLEPAPSELNIFSFVAYPGGRYWVSSPVSYQSSCPSSASIPARRTSSAPWWPWTRTTSSTRSGRANSTGGKRSSARSDQKPGRPQSVLKDQGPLLPALKVRCKCLGMTLWD